MSEEVRVRERDGTEIESVRGRKRKSEREGGRGSEEERKIEREGERVSEEEREGGTRERDGNMRE